MDRHPFTVEDLAKHWRVSASTVRRLIASGELATFRVGAQLRVPAEAVDAYEARTATAVAA